MTVCSYSSEAFILDLMALAPAFYSLQYTILHSFPGPIVGEVF